MSALTPVTFQNAHASGAARLVITKFRAASEGQKAIFDSDPLSDHYVDISVIEKAFAPWTQQGETPSGSDGNPVIVIPPEDAVNALAQFDALAEISPDAFTLSYRADFVREPLIRAAQNGMTVIISQED